MPPPPTKSPKSRLLSSREICRRIDKLKYWGLPNTPLPASHPPNPLDPPRPPPRRMSSASCPGKARWSASCPGKARWSASCPGKARPSVWKIRHPTPSTQPPPLEVSAAR
eukprot:337139-Prorocentrum_minimum.AAC.1